MGGRTTTLAQEQELMDGCGWIAGFGDGLLNLAEGNVCTLTAGNRQQDDWHRPELYDRSILYGEMFTHLPKTIEKFS